MYIIVVKLLEYICLNCNFSHTRHYNLFFNPGKSKEAEIKRINKELANIRSKFKGKPFFLSSMYQSILCMYLKKCTFFLGDRALDGYQKKKYVCKLLFIFLLGHDIDFGHMEAVNLLSSNKYSEKQIVSFNT